MSHRRTRTKAGARRSLSSHGRFPIVTGKPTTANSTRFDAKEKEISPGPGTYINQIHWPSAKPEFDEARKARRKLDLAGGAAGGH